MPAIDDGRQVKVFAGSEELTNGVLIGTTASASQRLATFVTDADASAPTIKAYIDNNGVLTQGVGTSTQTGTGWVVASVQSSVVGNVGAGEDDLMTYTLPANALNANNKAVRITLCGASANNANGKTVNVYFGSTVVGTRALTTSQANTWRFVVEVIRTGAAAQVAQSMMIQYGTSQTYSLANSTPNADTTAGIVIKATGTGTNDNDITQTMMIVEVMG